MPMCHGQGANLIGVKNKNIVGRKPAMMTANRHLAALVGLAALACASPGHAQTRTDHPGATRAEAIDECNRSATSAYPWFEDVSRADAYRACMAEHGQPE